MSDPAIGNVFRPLQRCSSVSVADDDVVEVVEPLAEKMSGKEAAASSVAAFALPPMQRCSKKRGLTDAVANSHREKMPRKEDVPSAAAGVINPTSKTGVLKVLTYNVWFREDLELNKRMKALGDLIQQHTPDVICFQEVTPNIYEIFQRSNWWKGYKCSLSYDMVADKAYFCMQMSKLPVNKFSCKPFGYSAMGRELSLADVDTGMGKSLVVATSHLESPCPGPPKWDQMYSKERVAQARESINFLDASPNVIFCGDMNWDDKLDGPFPMLEGWIDAWTALRPGEEGWTYDTKANLMLSGNRKLQKRLDRFTCSLRDFVVSSIEMLGMEAIPGLSYGKEKKVKSEYQTVMLPVLPSDHFGLLLTISQR